MVRRFDCAIGWSSGALAFPVVCVLFAGPLNPAGAQVAGKTADRTAEKSGDGQSKKAAKPARKPTRREFVELPGAPRTPIDGFRGKTRALAYEKPTDEQIDVVRRKRVDRQAIDAVAKANVYALANPNDELNIAKNVEDAVRPCRDASEEFAKIYKAAATKYCKDLLNNSLVVQVNAVLLIARLMDGTNDVKDGVPILVEILKQGTYEDAVVYLALRGLQNAKMHRLLDVQPEREAATAILSAARQPGVQPVLFEEMLVTMGVMGLAYTGDLPERANVGAFLANLSLDPTQSLRLRYEATHAFGSLNPGPLTGINWELVGYVLGNFLTDLAAAHKDNKIAEDTYRYWLFNLAKDFQSLTKSSGNQRFTELATAVKDFATAVISKQEADPQVIAAWIAKCDPQKEPRLAPPSSEPLKIPPKR